jgi:hypothetical protein
MCGAQIRTATFGGVDNVETVLEKLGTTESTTLAVRREESVKIRVASLLWEPPKGFCPARCWKSASLHVGRFGPAGPGL